MTKKTLVICNFPRFSTEIWLPHLWASAKTYYEQYGQRQSEWEWAPCTMDLYDSDYKDKIKELLLANPPTVFAISLYVWNYTLAHEMAKWVKTTWPECIVISGGPHQYFKHDLNWFKEHWYLDASLPGECYGELCFKELLDNYDDTTNTVKWNQVSDVKYASKSRNILSSTKSMSRSDKKSFEYNWSPIHTQLNELKQYAQNREQLMPKSMLLGILETTRGCPYGCTYCDWGGGTNTTVIQKDLAVVKQDIDAITEFDLTFLYIADANFGIFGQRDVDVMRYLVTRRKDQAQVFKTGYGGFAKTENRLEYIREILTLDVKNDLSLTKELKLSLQSLDEQVLKNIDRKNIDLDQQLEVYNPLAKDQQIPMYVEMIMGLPGLDLDKYYYELDVLGQNKLSVQWFEWILLPETPAYAQAYRTQYGIQTIHKYKGWACPEGHSDREVVVGCSSFTTDDYLQMLLSNSLYHLLVQGGFYKKTFTWINQPYGKIIRDIYEEYFVKLCRDQLAHVQRRWQQILSDSDSCCTVEVAGEEVYMQWYFIMLAFTQPNEFSIPLINWIREKYHVPAQIIEQDQSLTLTLDNINKNIFKGYYSVDFRKEYGPINSNLQIIEGLFRTYTKSGYVMRGQKKLLGLINISE